MSFLKKFLAFVMMFSLLNVAIPQKKAEAGLIVANTRLGVAFIVIGLIYGNLGLVILGEEGAENTMAANLANKYGHLSSNQDAFNGLAGLILSKTPANFVGELELSFSREEIEESLGAAAANQELVEAVAADLM